MTTSMLAASTSIHDIEDLLATHTGICMNPLRPELIDKVLEHREAIQTKSGALGTWNPAHSTGRIPKDTYMVRDASTEETIDWTAGACNPMTRELFDALLQDALTVLSEKQEIFVLERSVGQDPQYALGVQFLTDSPLSALFADNMFCPPAETTDVFTLIVLPYEQVDALRYHTKLREENGSTVPRVIAMDFTRKIGLVYGTEYLGCIKKTLFTVMNYLLPQQGILPLHCSANEGPEGAALFLGLSGTGKTTLSNDPERILIGDDEHGWSNEGIFNLEGGCYAKLINLEQDKEPDIFRAVFEPRDVHLNGCIIENALMYPDGTVDTTDSRLAENSRASYPLSFLPNTKEQARTQHPRTILFLTADASGVLPPVAKLSRASAMFWFLMGYTSKLAGTELGITKPVASFSRFFGAPFMPCHPTVYADLLGKKMEEHGSTVYLVNTGWTGGPHGVGKRFDISCTRAIVTAALNGTLEKLPYRRDERFHLDVPVEVPHVDSRLLNPSQTWETTEYYEEAANVLAEQCKEYFLHTYGKAHLPPEVRAICPGIAKH